MRSTRALVMIFLSLLAGIAAVLIASKWLSGRATQTYPVAVAARDLELGSALNPTMIELVDWPRESRPTGAFEASQPLDGRVLKSSVVRGEPIVESKLAAIGAKGGLSAVIKDGKRAVTVKVNEVVGVAGFALPGNYVDVMVNTQDEKSKELSKIVLERILVLAVAQEANQDQTKPKVVSAVTLEVTPGEAERLDLARSVGSLSLVLRNQADSNLVITDGVDKQELLRVAHVPAAVDKAVPPPAPAKAKRVVRRPAAAPAAAKPAPDKVEVIRGLQKSNSEV